jgi:KaiC/GvpD/RAD55 family RecA-like ATPase
MSAYPEGFSTWPEDRRNAYHAAAAAQYRRRQGEERAAVFKPAPPANYEPPGSSRPMREPFPLIRVGKAVVSTAGDYVVKGLLPREGVAVLYGASGSYKSFIALDLACAIAEGRAWAGRKTTQGGVIYIAAEGAGGMMKRIAAHQIQHEVATDPPLYLMAAQPDFGNGDDDCRHMIASVETTIGDASLAMIVIDTLAQTLSGADENGSGMTTFVANAQRLASRFGCLVAVVHHSGKDADRGLRGHSSLHGAVDAVLRLAVAGELRSAIVSEKVKDGEFGQTFAVSLSRVVVGTDDDGDPITSLVVDAVEPDGCAGHVVKERRPPPSQRLFMTTLAELIGDAGKDIRPGADWPIVRAVSKEAVRAAYYRRLPQDDKPEARRQAFRRALEAAVNRKDVVSREIGGEDFLWLPH